MAHWTCLLAVGAVGLLAPGCEEEKSGVPVPWLRAEPASSGRGLKIGYESDPCTQARKARVDEERGVVTVTLLDPQRDPDQACIQVVRPGCVTLRLPEPLGNRRVVDGARDPFPQRKRGADRLPFSRFGRCPPVPVER